MANLIIYINSMNTAQENDNTLNEHIKNLVARFREEYFNKPVKTTKQKVIWLFKYIMLPTLYIYAVIKPDFENLRQAVLIMMAFLLGLFQVLRVGIKFSTEFIELLKLWRKENIKIEGGRWVYVLTAICLILFIIGSVIIYLLVASSKK